jgi:hypothetical protein
MTFVDAGFTTAGAVNDPLLVIVPSEGFVFQAALSFFVVPEVHALNETVAPAGTVIEESHTPMPTP